MAEEHSAPLKLEGIGPNKEIYILDSTYRGRKTGSLQHQGDNYSVPLYPINFISKEDFEDLVKNLRRQKNPKERLLCLEGVLTKTPVKEGRAVVIAIISAKDELEMLVPKLYFKEGINVQLKK